MSSFMRIVREYGLRVEVAELGAWGSSALHAEYDARARTIRVNARSLRALHGARRRRFFVEAVAHELYHHLEHVGAVVRLPTHAQRECAARTFALRAL